MRRPAPPRLYGAPRQPRSGVMRDHRPSIYGHDSPPWISSIEACSSPPRCSCVSFRFLLIANALAGRSAASGLARHLGLNNQAAADVGQLFASSTATSNAVTGTAWLFFVLGGIAAATAIQQLYERAFDLDTRGMKDILRRLIWLVALVG